MPENSARNWWIREEPPKAVKQKYKVIFREPDTWWKCNPKELERRNQHGVKKEKIIKMLEHFEHVTVNSLLNLSHPKTSKNTANSQRKMDENNGDNMADTGSAAPASQKSLEVSKDGPECFPDAAGLEVKNLSTAENADYTEILQLVPTINIDNDDCANNDASVEATEDQQGLDKDSGSFLLNERPELLNFVGDWPVEQTMSQRAPRSRKARARPEKQNPSVQESGENDESTNPDSEQIDTANDQGQIDSGASEQGQLEEAAALVTEHHIDSSTVNSDGEEQLLELENPFCTSLTLHNKEDWAENEDQSEAAIVKISEVQEQVAESTNGEDIQGLSSVNEDVKVKPRQPRRSCKLALNFTNHCSITPKPNESKCFQQPSVDLCKFSQTEPQDFALAWRIEKKNVDVLDSSKIIIGKSSNFKSQSVDNNSDAQENIPYRVMHHKSTFVVEDDIISLGDQDSLVILCRLFRSLSFDVLKDLFERCNKDIEWTTNLLLDSGEKIYKEEECEVEESEDLESCSYSDKDNSSEITEEKSGIIAEEVYEDTETGSTDHSLKAPEYSPFVNALPLVVAEELKNGNVLSSNEMNLNRCRFTSELQERFPNHETITDTIVSDISWPSDLESEHGNTYHSSPNILQSSDLLKTITKGNKEEINLNHSNLSMKLDIRQPEILVGENNEAQEVREVTAVVEEETKTQNESNARSRSKESLQFDYLELALPPEFAFQLTELFGPVGIDPGSLTIEDCVVPIDLKLAECIHKKWKESIMERHRQEALSYQLILQDSIRDDPVDLDKSLQESESGVSQRETDLFPFMDQWNTRINKVSLREIIAEEMAIQAHEDSKKAASSKNCAVKLKEKQLLELFPHVEQQLLLDIFKENDYNLEKTEQFMSSVLEADPVRNVIAQGFKQAAYTATERSKEKKLKSDEDLLNERYFQDLEYPNYNDFRAEAFLYHQKQQESYRKAAEAHHRGMKQVAAYYAQQGYLYGQKMKEENQRAAVQIFERANEYLLPENILDLHGLHVDEAMKHLRKVLQEKTDEFKQNGGKPHLLVITGRGNHSQGGVPRIKPAVMDFLTNHDYRFQEKTPGVLRINLK
ncbi:hypothetical protein GDO78_014105 [Eleutherodactylus coqui]|uniref:Smr domain-containing protein n=1 Tax=Eleutherodactylus coqui TaxID=57060 RepID=A0A8J6EF62_ELECQ|nr:hypothetical protein GDO78_014105 [Eleutherodactylus coqui]